MLQGLRDTYQRANRFKTTCKTLGYMIIIVCKIPSRGGGDGKIISILWPINKIYVMGTKDLGQFE